MDKATQQLLQSEGIVKRATVTWFKAKLNAQPSTAFLTPKRLVIQYNGNPMAGILLRLILKSQGPRVVANIPLEKITSVEEEKYGINKVALIQWGDGESIRVGGIKVEEWQDAINQQSGTNTSW